MRSDKLPSNMDRNLFGGLILASFLVCGAVAGEPMTQGAGGGKIDYVAQFNELIGKGSDENLNAELFYRKASALCATLPPVVDVWSWPTDWSSEERSSVENYVKANADALAQLRLGTRRPSYWFRFQGSSVPDVTANQMRFLQSVRLLVFALTFQTKIEGVGGKIEDAVEDILAGCRFALDVRRRLLMVDQLAGIAASNYALDTGFQVVGRCVLDPALWERLQDRLTELAKDAMWQVDFRGQEVYMFEFAREVCAHVHRNPDRADIEALKRLLPDMWTQRDGDPATGLTMEQLCSFAETHKPEEWLDEVRRGHAYLHSLAPKTPFQWRGQEIDFARNWPKAVDGNPLLSSLATAIARVCELSFRMKVQRDALITTLALLRHKTERRALPADLQELVAAGYVAEVPLDPYSDKPLVYKRTTDDFLLYSVGADFKDDGGPHDRRWGQNEEGGDYVFWPVRMK